MGTGVIQGMIQSNRENLGRKKSGQFFNKDIRKFEKNKRYGYLNEAILKTYTVKEKAILLAETKRKNKRQTLLYTACIISICLVGILVIVML